MDYSLLIGRILEDSSKSGLPAAPTYPTQIADRAAAIMEKSEALIGGEAVGGAYYQSSRDRFDALLRLSLRHVRAKGRILDIGNAPGYLAIMLAEAGFDIDGVNLSDEWNATYPNPKYVKQFRVVAADIEKQVLPYANGTFDAIVFTEVLEHIAITHPAKILAEFTRVLKAGGVIIFSTPNVCNVSNIVALAKGLNVFWGSDMFYGSTDRHNREWAPEEVLQLFSDGGFDATDFFGMNDHANWRAGAAQHIYEFQAKHGTPDHTLMRNTIVGAFVKRSGNASKKS